MPTPSQQDPPQDPDTGWIRTLHDTTHEVELIISGAVLFGLLQLPGRLDGWFDMVNLRLDDAFWTGTFLAWYYAKLILYVLIVAFGLHLVSRAYWVGLVGLDSAYPGGIDWDRIRYGPLAKRVYKKEIRPLASLARRADRFCSSIFAFAFWIVLIFLLSIMAAAFAGAVAFVVAALSGGGVSFGRVWFVVIALLATVQFTAMAVDRVMAGRLAGDGPAARGIARLVRGLYHAFAGPLILPTQFVLFSRGSKLVMWTLYVGVFVGVVVMFLGVETARSGDFVLSPSALLPDRPGARSVHASYFADTRDPVSTAPFVQSEVISGPYVRLELPLVARKDTDRMSQACGEVAPLGSLGLARTGSREDPPPEEAMAEVLDCLAGLWSVSLDGLELDGLAWDFRSLPGAGVTGLLTYIPTGDLEAGAHVLEVSEVLPEPETSEATPGEEGDRPRRHLIRFRI